MCACSQSPALGAMGLSLNQCFNLDARRLLKLNGNFFLLEISHTLFLFAVRATLFLASTEVLIGYYSC